MHLVCGFVVADAGDTGPALTKHETWSNIGGPRLMSWQEFSSLKPDLLMNRFSKIAAICRNRFQKNVNKQMQIPEHTLVDFRHGKHHISSTHLFPQY